ncbi:MAG: FkbM family methyltransferase [Methylobacterium sp.]|uniref:FkbM family methyltransferase n=1 Tax=Methylobacterium sp. TaxID=409 RepID=UPI0025ED573E|nr:FkbM family methyltransferase [Methylobacterium sp.]MBX9932026.1 FkbM family methyltransferase [Methylobacterium sp.]
MLQAFKPQIKQALGGLSHAAARKGYVRQVLFNAMAQRSPEITRLHELEELRFLSHCFLDFERSCSQILQDLWVTFETEGLQEGFFVEFGATNGRVNSNTWLLEKQYGWSGILAEPNPVWHADLSRNRVCEIEHRCIAARSGERVEFVTATDPELSTIATCAAGDHFASVRLAAPRISVETLSLNDLLAERRAPMRIDYMSVDTEGSEFEILSAFDFDRYDVRLLSIEHNNTGAENEIEALMESNGYVRKFPEFSQWDAWFVRA